MQKRKFSPVSTALSLTLIVVGITVFLNHKKDREIIAADVAKSKLTNEEGSEKPTKVGLKELIKKNLGKQEEVAQAQTGSANLLTQERTFTEAEINDMTEEQFTALVQDTERKLPKLSDIKQLPAGALHMTPPIVIQAGRDLGVIKEVLNVHESYSRVALPFYKSCAKNDEGVTPVRALCLTNLIEIKKKNGESVNLKEYPEKLIELTKMVTEI